MIAELFQLLPPQVVQLLPYLPRAEAIENAIIIFFVMRRLMAVYRRERAIERRLTVSVKV